MTDFAAWAAAGDLEALAAIADGDAASKADRVAYKWLAAAADFGHDEAEDLIEDLLETSSLRYDDSRLEQGAAHWELAVAYLAGEEGLPVDLRRAQEHLEQAFEAGAAFASARRDAGLEDATASLAAINDGTGERYAADVLLARLDGDARNVLQFALDGGDLYRRVETRLADLAHLRSCRAPTVILDDAKQRLQVAWNALQTSDRHDALVAPPGRNATALGAAVEAALELLD